MISEQNYSMLAHFLFSFLQDKYNYFKFINILISLVCNNINIYQYFPGILDLLMNTISILEMVDQKGEFQTLKSVIYKCQNHAVGKSAMKWHDSRTCPVN